jgi:integrase/recombinase XerD
VRRPVAYRSVLRTAFAAFVALKQACGAGYTTQADHLHRFDEFLVSHGVRRVRAQDIRAFLTTKDHLVARGRENICSVVWPALEHARRHGGPVDALPPRPTFKPDKVRQPYILTDDEIERLLSAAKSRRVKRGSTPSATYATLLGLLLVTGLRINEALSLEVRDLDLSEGVLHVRAGKFKKSRLVPLTDSAVAALRMALGRRPAPSAPLLPAYDGARIGYQGVRAAFRKIVASAKVQSDDGRRPRIHDLRHTFAVRTVVGWLRRRRDPAQLLAVLATYMGHVRPHSTQVYLQPNHLTLTEAARRFASTAAPRRGKRAK